MGMTLEFTLNLRSDYHVAAGYGEGAIVDSALQRDVDGIPVLRGTTLVGLLRDGLYQLLRLEPLKTYGARCKASGSDGATAPDYCGQHGSIPMDEACPICRIFGSPQITKRWRIGSARPIGALSTPIRPPSFSGAADAGAIVAPHVRVSPRTRRAEARKLFFREEGDRQLTFGFAAECDADDAAARDDAAWLVAAAQMVRHLGAGRRRGRGECRMSLQDPALQKELLDYFEKTQVKLQASPPVSQKKAYTSTVPESFQAARPVQRLVIARLEEPLLISRRAVAGNEFQSTDYIPGSVLRGALASCVAAQYDLSDAHSATYAAFVALFHRGQVQFPTLYPTYPGAEGSSVNPTIVAPLDLLTCELFPGFVPQDGSAFIHGAESYAHKPGATDPTCDHEGCSARRIPFDGYLPLPTYRLGPFEHGHRPKRVTEMHVRIEPMSGRAAEGDLFDYDALAPGQFFIGQLTCATAQAWQDLCALTGLPSQDGEIELRLGKANRRGYGRVKLYLRTPTVDERGAEIHPWHIVDIVERVKSLTNLKLTLLTDTIVMDAWGRFQTGFDSRWLSQALDLPVDVVRGFSMSQPVDTFNAYLGLPRWRDVALRAGSAVGLTIAGQPSLAAVIQKLRAVEQAGIGLRRNEGFGRVVFNHPVYDDGGPGNFSYEQDVAPLEIKGADADSYFSDVQFRADWEEALAGSVNDAHQVEVDAGEGKKIVDPWSKFRQPRFETVARVLRTDVSLPTLTAFLEKLKAEEAGLTKPLSAATITAYLDQIGASTQLLPKDLVDSDLKVRECDKESLNFLKTKGKAGRDVLVQLLALLESKVPGKPEAQAERLWRLGLDMLADRIADEARQAVAEVER